MMNVMDAMRPVRLCVGRFREWPFSVEQSAKELVELMDRLAAAWGWEWLKLPPGARDREFRKRLACFHEEVKIPLIQSALNLAALKPSWEEIGEFRNALDEQLALAQAQHSELTPQAVPPEAARKTFLELLSLARWDFRFSEEYPTFEKAGVGFRDEFEGALRVLKSHFTHAFAPCSEQSLPLAVALVAPAADPLPKNALDWPETRPQLTKPHKPERGAKLTTDAKATALLFQWQIERKPITVQAVASALGVSRARVLQGVGFKAAWKAYQANIAMQKDSYKKGGTWKARHNET